MSVPDLASLQDSGFRKVPTCVCACTCVRVHVCCFAPKASHYKRKTQIEYDILSSHNPSVNHDYKCIGGGFSYPDFKTKSIAKAIPKESFSSEDASVPKNIFDVMKNFLDALYWFCYPYSVIARTLITIATSLLAVNRISDISPLFLTGLLQVLIPHLFMDIYVGGVNQLFDLEIDKINKPFLPLASGQLSFTTGVIITVSSLILSFGFGWITGSWPLIWGLVLCCALWTAYSVNVPLLRWKRNPLLAAMVIFATWACVFPITSFLHMQTFVLKMPANFPKSLFFIIAFMSFYSIGIAMLKDIPDMEGDKLFGINSFSACLGQKRVFWICVSFFEMAFGVALLFGLTSSSLWIKMITGIGYAVHALILWNHAKSIDLKSKASVGSFYMLIWKMLSTVCFLLPLAR
ncbi:hypothetical protein VNO78_02671 [Psophocarpus tetragonolobus]|uniref:Glycinol 4-dimethylallyltransferase n=1 Tax=Psophocarpus tetragonolobus TaxID=3891 RepID=A0AAN9T2V2_PSOTE